METFGPECGPMIKMQGQSMRKKPSIVYLWRPDVTEDFGVNTNEGPTTAKPGDYIAYDEQFNHVWPIAADYVAAHYEEAADGAPATVVTQDEYGARLVADPGFTFETELIETGPSSELVIRVVPVDNS